MDDMLLILDDKAENAKFALKNDLFAPWVRMTITFNQCG